MNRGSLIFFNDLSFATVNDTILCHPIRRPVHVVKVEKSNNNNKIHDHSPINLKINSLPSI